jgi:hypothetical protein
MPPAAFFVAYAGRSMNPTLVEPELLEIAPYDGTPACAGDVIFFVHGNISTPVVHRVVRVTQAGLVTRGDNSAQDDDGVCPPAEVRGRVVAAWRGQQRRVIRGGRPGRLWAWSLRGRHLLLVLGVRLLSRPYHAIARAGLLRPLVPPALRPRVLVFQSSGIEQYRLVVGRYVVGAYDATRRAWRVQPPFLLFIDETALPPNLPGEGQTEAPALPET